MKVTIKVTKEIIEKAMMCGVQYHMKKIVESGLDIPSVAENCAIALAVREVFPKAAVLEDTEKSHHMIRYCCSDQNTIIVLPKQASKFIRDFDRKSVDPTSRLMMEPLSFEVEVPEELINEIGIGEIYKVLSESRTLELAM